YVVAQFVSGRFAGAQAEAVEKDAGEGGAAERGKDAVDLRGGEGGEGGEFHGGLPRVGRSLVVAAGAAVRWFSGGSVVVGVGWICQAGHQLGGVGAVAFLA